MLTRASTHYYLYVFAEREVPIGVFEDIHHITDFKEIEKPLGSVWIDEGFKEGSPIFNCNANIGDVAISGL